MKKGKRRERKRPQKAEPTNKECCIVVLYFCNYTWTCSFDISLVHEHAEFLIDECNHKVRGHKVRVAWPVTFSLVFFFFADSHSV